MRTLDTRRPWEAVRDENRVLMYVIGGFDQRFRQFLHIFLYRTIQSQTESSIYFTFALVLHFHIVSRHTRDTCDKIRARKLIVIFVNLTWRIHFEFVKRWATGCEMESASVNTRSLVRNLELNARMLRCGATFYLVVLFFFLLLYCFLKGNFVSVKKISFWIFYANAYPCFKTSVCMCI